MPETLHEPDVIWLDTPDADTFPTTSAEMSVAMHEAEDYFAARPLWTWRRVVLLMIALVIIALIVVYVALPALQFWMMPVSARPLSPPVSL